MVKDIAIARGGGEMHSCRVGDSPEGPLNKPGGILLKTCKKPKRNTSHLSAHTGHGPHCGGPRIPPEWPSQRLPRAGSASLEGSSPPHSRPPHEHACSRTRAFNALTRQSRAIMRLGITPRRCSANSLGETHPRHCGGLCDMASVSSVALCRPLPYG
jgi:hypothetical protein